MMSKTASPTISDACVVEAPIWCVHRHWGVIEEHVQNCFFAIWLTNKHQVQHEETFFYTT